MMNKRLFAVFFSGVFLVSLASAQTLAEAAKKEKERRETVKNKTSIPVTNADLGGVKKKPAVDSPKTEPAKEPPPLQEEPPAKVPDAAVESQRDYEAKKADLGTKHAAAKERLGLLNLKLQSLWQQYYAPASLVPKEQIQKEIAETGLKLKEAAAEEAKIRDDLARLAALAPPTVIK